ncbi:DNA polymerase Y family protein [Nevskia sp.]|uniref:Y-family DNA polymerase n=1 Tax=Nevskia sp. TaxID=1929292 RepID=UPI0025F16072|nr:DNA polymerase Y family protein [Nevskia sp.]
MLWLCLHLPQFSLEALGDASASQVVTGRRGARRWVIAGAADRIAPGTDWGTVQVLHPDLRAAERKPRAERETMQALAAWAWRYGSELVWEITESELDFGLPCALLWVEIGASLKLYGGLEALLAHLDAGFAETGHVGSLAVAPTLEAAALFARIGLAEPVIEREQLPAVLDALPLASLMLTPRTLEALKAIGLSRIGELLALPAAALGKRHGAQLVTFLDRLLGRRPDVRPRWRPPAKFQRRIDLLGEVEYTEGLLFPLQRMTRELGNFLKARDTGLQVFRLTLLHGRASGGRLQADTVLDLRLATSARDPERLLRVLREQLSCTPLPAPVRSLRLNAEQFIEPATGQRDLFDATRGDDEAWSQLVEKLVARLGAEAVTSLGLIADHRPERSWRTRACDAPPAEVARVTAPPRPIWLIDPPKPLSTTPKALAAAERLEGGWWDGGDVLRDYYHADLHGGRFWVFQDRLTSAWFLQGIWA